MELKIPIRNPNLPQSPRVFDVTVNEKGKILRYDMQNIKGRLFVENAEVEKQIKEALEQKAG